MSEDGILLAYNPETKMWDEKKEPYATIECETEEDYNFLLNAVRFYKEHHKGDDDNG